MTNSNVVYCANILHYSHSLRYYVVPRFASEHTVTDVVNSSFDNLYLSHLLICDAKVDCRAASSTYRVVALRFHHSLPLHLGKGTSASL